MPQIMPGLNLDQAVRYLKAGPHEAAKQLFGRLTEKVQQLGLSPDPSHADAEQRPQGRLSVNVRSIEDWIIAIDLPRKDDDEFARTVKETNLKKLLILQATGAIRFAKKSKK